MSEAKMAVSVLLNARDKLTGSVSNAKRMTSRLGRTITRIGRNPGFQKIRHHITRTAGAAKRLGMRLGKIGAGLGVAAAGVTAALGHMTAKFASSADETAKMADQVGIGVEALQEWRFVAERQGVSQEKFNQSLGAFTKRVGEAQNGTGALTTQLKKSNPELLKQLQNAKSTSEALDLYLKAIGKAPTATQKAAMASAGFSRAGLAMIRITRDGAANIDALRQRARDLGLVLDEKTARQAEAFDDRLTDLQGSLTGVKNIMGAQLLPVFTKVMDQMTRWIVKNQDTVRQWAKQFAADLPDRLAALKKHFNEIVDAAGRFLDKAKPLAKTVLHVADRFGRMNTAVAAVAAIIAAPILAPLASLTAALVGLGGTLISLSATAIPGVVSAFTWMAGAIAANPIGATITAIAGAAFLIYKYWGPIKAFASNVWGAVQGAVSGVWDWLTNLDWSAAGKKLIMTFVSGLKHAAGAVKDAVKGALSKARNLLPFSDAREGPLSDLTKSGTRLPSTFASGVVKNQKALIGAFDKIKGVLGFNPLAVLGPLWDGIKGYVGGILDAVHKIVGGDVSGILDLFVALNPLNIIKPAFDGAWNWISSLDWSALGTKLIHTLINGIKNAAGALKDAVTGAVSGAFDKVKDGVSGAGRAVKDSVSNTLSKARNLLPFSDAKEGPLSDLTKSGRALPATFAQGVTRNQAAVVGAVNKVMRAANEPLTRPVRGPTIVPLRAAGAKTRQNGPTVDAGSSAVALQTTEREAHHTTERVVERERSPQGAAVALFGHAGAPGAGTGRRTPIGRVEVNAPINIRMDNNATPQDVGNAVRGELTNHDMWRTVQDIPED